MHNKPERTLSRRTVCLEKKPSHHYCRPRRRFWPRRPLLHQRKTTAMSWKSRLVLKLNRTQHKAHTKYYQQHSRFNGNDGDKKCCSLAWIGKGPSTCQCASARISGRQVHSRPNIRTVPHAIACPFTMLKIKRSHRCHEGRKFDACPNTFASLTAQSFSSGYRHHSCA
jgi:hypothetical protein